MRKAVAIAALVVGMSLSAASPSSAVPLTLGDWQDFGFGGVGSVSSFDFASAGPVIIRVVDGFIIGDEFTVSLDGGLGLPTSDSSANDGVQSGAQDGDTAFADARLSRLIIAAAAGAHTIDVTVTRNATGSQSGSAFIRVDEDRVPEPVSLLLFGGGLAAFAFIRRRRG
jgi:hypothetical protein